MHLPNRSHRLVAPLAALLLAFPSRAPAQSMGAETRIGAWQHEQAQHATPTYAAGAFYSHAFHRQFSVRASVLVRAASGPGSTQERTSHMSPALALYICPEVHVYERYYLRSGIGLERHTARLTMGAAEENGVKAQQRVVGALEVGRQLGRFQIGARYTAPLWASTGLGGNSVDIGSSYLLHHWYRNLPKRRKWRRTILPWAASDN